MSQQGRNTKKDKYQKWIVKNNYGLSSILNYRRIYIHLGYTWDMKYDQKISHME